jgi:hypothetical protein
MLRHELEDSIGIEACSLTSIWRAIIAFIFTILVLSYFVAG